MHSAACLCDIDKVNDYVFEKGIEYDWKTLYRTSYDMDADELEEKVKKGGFLGLKPYLSNCPPYIPSNETRIFDFLPHSHLEKADKNGWIIMLHIPRQQIKGYSKPCTACGNRGKVSEYQTDHSAYRQSIRKRGYRKCIRYRRQGQEYIF